MTEAERKAGCFALEVSADDRDTELQAGDYCVFEPRQADPGDIIAVTTESGYTVRRFITGERLESGSGVLIRRHRFYK